MLISYVIICASMSQVIPIYGAQFGKEADEKVNDSLVVVVDPNFMNGKWKYLAKSVKNIILKTFNKLVTEKLLSLDFHNNPDLTNKEGITAVLSLASCEDTWKIFDTVQEAGTLFISLTEPNCPRLPESAGVTIPLTNSESEMMQLILDLRVSQIIKWKSMNVIYDNSIQNSVIQEITQVLTMEIPITGESSSISLYKIDGSYSELQKQNRVMDVLKIIPKENSGNYIVFIKIEMVAAVLGAAKSLKLTDPKNQWLFVLTNGDFHNDNVTNYATLISDGENVAFVYNQTDFNVTCKTGLNCHVEEMTSSLSVALSKAISEEFDLSEQVSEEEWDAIKPSRLDRRNSLLRFMKNKLKDIGQCGNCSRWILKTSENWGHSFLKKENYIKFLTAGYWAPISGLFFIDHLFPHIDHGFRGITLPIATFHFPPWQIIKTNQSGFPNECKGLVFEILNELAKNLNFTYNIINLANTSLQTPSKPSNNMNENVLNATDEFIAWDNIVGIIKQNKVFLGAAAFTVTEERKKSINFTTPVSIEPYAFLASRPRELSRALLFIRPFTSDAWLCIIGAIAIMTPLLNLVHRVSPYYEHYSSRERGGYHKMVNCFWYIYGALLQQGGALLPEADSGRLIIGTWWLVVLVIVTTYSGNLVAFLTFPQTEKIISNVDQLLAKRDVISWGMPAVSTLHSLLLKTNDEKLNRLSEEAILHKELTPDFITKIRTGSHIYIERKSNLLFLMKSEFLKTNRCAFALGQEEFLEEHLAMAMPLGSPYLKIINKEISRMHKTGLIQKWLKDYLPKKDRCWKTGLLSGEFTHTVNLEDMQGSFFLLLFGIFIGVLLMLMEALFKKWRRNQERGVIRPYLS